MLIAGDWNLILIKDFTWIIVIKQEDSGDLFVVDAIEY
jgi:hypothetical protein